MKKEFIEPEIDVILLDSEISTDETLPGFGSGFTDGDGL
jgi:hypothetical protein